MSETSPNQRQLRPATTTGRAAAQTGHRRGIGRVFRAIGRQFGRFGRLPLWRPFRAAGRLLGRILFPHFLRSSFRELGQVTWPSRRQTLQLTGAVILFSVVFGVVVAIFDAGLDRLFKQVIIR